MPKVTFQHLTSDTGVKTQRGTIYLFGRTEVGESIAVVVNGYKPHITVRVSTDKKKFEEKITNSLCALIRSERIHNEIKRWKSNEISNYKLMKLSVHLSFKWHKGQDLCDFNEDGPTDFVTIRTDPRYFHTLKMYI